MGVCAARRAAAVRKYAAGQASCQGQQLFRVKVSAWISSTIFKPPIRGRSVGTGQSDVATVVAGHSRDSGLQASYGA